MRWGNTMGQRMKSLFRLVRSALVTSVAHVRRGWWRQPPFLPLPDPKQLAWRRTTAYGTDRPAESHDLVSFLLWADRQRRAAS